MGGVLEATGMLVAIGAACFVGGLIRWQHDQRWRRSSVGGRAVTTIVGLWECVVVEILPGLGRTIYEKLTGFVDERYSRGLTLEKSRNQGAGGKRRVTLVLDLDETLVHTFVQKPHGLIWFGRIQCVPKTVLISNRFVQLYVGIRPHLEFFLKEISNLFHVVIYTSAEKHYAEPIIDMLAKETGTSLEERYYRDSCKVLQNGIPLKDLSVLQRDMDSVAIVDNSESGYVLNFSNGIPIKTWEGDPFDRELLNLLPFLRALSCAEDVRTVISM